VTETVTGTGVYRLERTVLDHANPLMLSQWDTFRRERRLTSWMHDPEWLRGYFEGQTNNLFVFSLYEADRLCGMAPFLLRDWPMSWYLGEKPAVTFPMKRLRLLGASVAFQEDELLYDRLFRELATSDVGYHALYFDGVPVDSFLWKYLQSSEEIRKHFVAYQPEPCQPNLLLRVEGTFEQYMGKFGSKQRNDLKRKIKRLRDSPLGPMRLIRYERPEEVAEFMEKAVKVSQKTYQWIQHQRGLWATELITQRLRFAAERGWIRCYLLVCGDRPCAFLTGYQCSGTLLLDEIGFDPELAKYSAGTVMQLQVVEDLFEHNSPAVFDLGPYKEVLSTESYHAGKVFLMKRGIYPRFLQTGDQCFRSATNAVASALDRFGWKAKVRQMLRGWDGSAPQESEQ
jgi:hypothetical protein